MKKILLSLALGASLLLASPPARSAAQEGIAAVVNDSVITVTDVKDRAALYLTGGAKKLTPEQRAKIEQQVLSRLIDETLQLQEARKLGIAVGDEEVAAGFADIARQNGLKPEEFRKRIAKSGAGVASLHNQIRAELSWSKVVRRKLRPQVSISEGEIDSTLDQIARNSERAHYRVAEIFLGVPAPAQDAAVREEAERLLKQIAKGAPFAALAHDYSQAPGAAVGGDLGWVQEGQLDPELDKALARMQPGQVSKPLRSAQGYHILFLADARRAAPGAAAGALEDEQSRDKVAAQLGFRRLEQMAQRYLRDLRATAFIDKRI